MRAVVAALQLGDLDPEPLASGLSSLAWRIRSAGGDSVLRLPVDKDDGVGSYPIEHALLACLIALDAPVPAPIQGSWLIPGWQLDPFSLASFVPGVRLRPESSEWAAAPIAAFLRLLHSIPADGFGPLVEVDGQLGGRCNQPEAGLQAAFEGFSLWPFAETRLSAHPAWLLNEQLLSEVETYAELVAEVASRGPAVIVHSDLHEENILEDEGRLGFIDFGECFIGSSGWDFAAIAYFSGWSLAERVAVAYLAGPDPRRVIESVPALALCFGLFRWQQDRRLGVDAEAHNEAFVRQSLARLSVR